MKGDFARFTFDPTLHYSQVLQQQGRVLLDADWNEQGRIQLHLLRAFISDLVGRCWAAGNGFDITGGTDATGKALQLPNWPLPAGHLYVDGILCVNETDCTLATQPTAPVSAYGVNDGSNGFDSSSLPTTNFALVVDVWERHLCAVEAPEIADLALDGIDTASRAQVAWQVRLLDPAHAERQLDDITAALNLRPQTPDVQRQLEFVARLRDSIDGKGDAIGSPCTLVQDVLDARTHYAMPGLSAALGQPPATSDPCMLAPDARYRGCENQLYRVEIHQGGVAGSTTTPGSAAAAAAGTAVGTPTGPATFKWSRENGSVVFPIVFPANEASLSIDNSAQQVVAVGCLGRDARLGLAVNDWVELVDDDYTLAQRACVLRQVFAIDPAKCEITLAALLGGAPDKYSLSAQKHPMLRRWDQQEGTNPQGVLAVAEGSPIALEDNLQITFAPGGLYATGDYWLIPARVAGSGQLDWPKANGASASLPPRGLHHYAVLGVADANQNYTNCCCRFDTLCTRAVASQQPGVPANNMMATAPAAATKSPNRKAVITPTPSP